MRRRRDAEDDPVHPRRPQDARASRRAPPCA
jgi:hypothetical protein